MNLEYYKTFLTLFKTRSFSITAENMHVAQSTISKRIKELENYYERELFYRTNKTVEVTEAGEKLHPLVVRMVQLDEVAKEDLHSLKYPQILKIGTPHAAYSGYLKPALMQLMREKTDLAFKVYISHTQLLLEQLYDDIIDLALVFYTPNTFEVNILAKITDRIVLVRKKEHMPSKMLKFQDLKSKPMIKTDLGDAFEYWLNEQTSEKLDYILEIDQIYEALDYVTEGFGYCFLPELIAKKYIEADVIEAVQIEDFPYYEISHYLVHKVSEKKATALQQVMIDIAEAMKTMH